MISYADLRSKASQFTSLAGMSVADFELLHNDYELQWNNYISHFRVDGTPRQRPHRKRKDGKLEDTRDQLLFILHYLKGNALQEHHAAAYGMNQPQANGWIHLLLSVLRKTLKELGALPERRAWKIKELLDKTEQVYIDGTERDIERPGGFEEQKEHYSGKKKAIK